VAADADEHRCVVEFEVDHRERGVVSIVDVVAFDEEFKSRGWRSGTDAVSSVWSLRHRPTARTVS
jgi:hypothetical protein